MKDKKEINRKLSVIFAWVILALVLFPTLGSVLSFCLGYTLRLKCGIGYAVLTAAMSVGAVILYPGLEANSKPKYLGVLFAALMPLSAISASFCLIRYHDIPSAVGMLICAGCCCRMTVGYFGTKAVTVVSTVLASVLLAVGGFIGITALLFAENTVVKTVDSPNGTYYAQVIDSDQGALGGDTLVYVYENRKLDAGLFDITKRPKRVYLGEWGAFKNMDIYWENEDCIVINSHRHSVGLSTAS